MHLGLRKATRSFGASGLGREDRLLAKGGACGARHGGTGGGGGAGRADQDLAGCVVQRAPRARPNSGSLGLADVDSGSEAPLRRLEPQPSRTTGRRGLGKLLRLGRRPHLSLVLGAGAGRGGEPGVLLPCMHNLSLPGPRGESAPTGSAGTAWPGPSGVAGRDAGFPGTGTRGAWGAWGRGGVETGGRQSLHRPRFPASQSPRSAWKGSGKVLLVQGPRVAPPTLKASSPPGPLPAPAVPGAPSRLLAHGDGGRRAHSSPHQAARPFFLKETLHT